MMKCERCQCRSSRMKDFCFFGLLDAPWRLDASVCGSGVIPVLMRWFGSRQTRFISILPYFWASCDVVQYLVAACYPDRTYRSLVESHEGTHASWCENCP